MKIEVKNYIKLELRNYMNNKWIIEQILPYDIITQRHFLWIFLLVKATDLALVELPPEVADYARERYFSGSNDNISVLSHKLNISERTIKRYDRTLIETVARNMGIFRE